MDDAFLLTLVNAAPANGASVTLDGPYPFHYTLNPLVFPDIRTLAPGERTDKLQFLLAEANHVQASVSFNSTHVNRPALLRPIVVTDTARGTVGQILLLVFLRVAAPTSQGGTTFSNADIEDVVIVRATDRVLLNGRPLQTLADSVELAPASGVQRTCSQTTLSFCTQLHIAAVRGLTAAEAGTLMWDQEAETAALSFHYTDHPAPAPAPPPPRPVWPLVLGALLGVLVLVALGYGGWRWWQQRRALLASQRRYWQSLQQQYGQQRQDQKQETEQQP